MKALLAVLLLQSATLQPTREWCEQWAATDGELEWCAETYPGLFRTEEEWLAEYGCRLERPGEEPEDADDIFCDEESE